MAELFSTEPILAIRIDAVTIVLCSTGDSLITGKLNVRNPVKHADTKLPYTV